MTSDPFEPGRCPACGAGQPPGTAACPSCGSPVPTVDESDPRPLIEGLDHPVGEPSPEDAPPATAFGVASPTPARSGYPWGIVLMAVGVAAILFGVSLVIAGAFISHSVQSFNQQCSGVPGCQPESDHGPTWIAGGVGLMVVGGILSFLGVRRGLSWQPRLPNPG